MRQPVSLTLIIRERSVGVILGDEEQGAGRSLVVRSSMIPIIRSIATLGPRQRWTMVDALFDPRRSDGSTILSVYHIQRSNIRCHMRSTR